MKLLKTLLITALTLSPLANANSDLAVSQAYARATPPNAVNSAVFATFINHDKADRVIVSAASDAAEKVELHDVIVEGEVMKMRQIDSIRVKANSDLVLKPGSLHIMLLGITQPLAEGQKVTITLTYEDGGRFSFDAPVKKVMAGMKMKQH
ncbi:copper chaperone PCu(A)C [Vibrio sp.]|uniref:copper chaperone PCu(A)C n=1 Tax=Vibrio sp. TaxID=678 RepID=UPI003D0D3AAC